jgi:hypothetical protein
MYLVLLHGQAALVSPGCSGAPTVCMQGTKVPSSPSTSNTARPMRVMMRMLTATYGLSLSSTPMWAMGEPSGPMLNGTTYIVRPFMQPLNSALSPLQQRAHLGRRHPVVGGAGVVLLLALQMKVRSSTRATSLGSLSARKLFGRLAGFSFLKVPASTSCWHRRSYSAWLPSHQ